MRTARTLALALLGALVGLASGALAAEVRARSSSEFLQLLRDSTNGCSGNATIRLAGAVALGKAAVDTVGLSLPLPVPPGCTLSIVGGARGPGESGLGPAGGGAAAACRSSYRSCTTLTCERKHDGLPGKQPGKGTERVASLLQSRPLPSLCHASAEGDGIQELELGASDAGIPQRLLFLASGSLVILEKLNLTGAASPAVGKVGLPSGIDVSVSPASGKGRSRAAACRCATRPACQTPLGKMIACRAVHDLSYQSTGCMRLGSMGCSKCLLH